MHLVCLGVARKLLVSWVKGPLIVRLGSRIIDVFSDRLLTLVPFIPCDFARKPRSLNQLAYFKATEYWQLLWYTGPIVLNGVLPDSLYSHLMLLYCAIKLLPYDNNDSSIFDLAQLLLLKFVVDCKNLYGVIFLSVNVHNLIHLVLDRLMVIYRVLVRFPLKINGVLKKKPSKNSK